MRSIRRIAKSQRPARIGAFRRITIYGFSGIAILGSWAAADARPAKTRHIIPQGWAWVAQRGAAPNLQPFSGIPPNRLAVAWLGQRDKITYLGIEGPTLKRASLKLKVDAEASSNINPEEAELRGCVILQEWIPGEAMAWDQKPLTDCDKQATARFEKKIHSFVLDLAPIARALSSPAAYGVSIEPVEAPTAQFQVVFKGRHSVILRFPPDTGRQSPQPRGDEAGESGGFAAAGEPPPPIDIGPATTNSDPFAPLSQETPPAQPQAATPVEVASPTTAESDPPTFAWAYAALVGIAASRLGTRVLMYSLPRGKRR